MHVGRLSGIALGLALSLSIAACERADESSPVAPVSGELSTYGNLSCNFGEMWYTAWWYFPGYGENSPKGTVLGLIGDMKDACQEGNRTAYTAHWYEVAAVVEEVLEAGSGGHASKGGRFLTSSVSIVGPDGVTPMFDPCDGAADCEPWDGFPTPPDFTSILDSPDGTWAVVTLGSDAVCSGFVHPCTGWDAGLMGDGWGVEPSVSWEAALGSRPTVLFGLPIPGPSPSGEQLLETDLPAYAFNLIPNPAQFDVDAVPPAVLEVGLCSTSTTSIDELLVQKYSTVLTEATLDWCDSQLTSLAGSGKSAWERLFAFLSPRPTPLVATVAARRGPGGSAGNFSDFYAIDLPREALLGISGQPGDGLVGETIPGDDGGSFAVRAFTSSVGSPLENADITLRVVRNGGLVPSGNEITAEGLVCDGAVCTGRVRADQQSEAGTLPLNLTISKPGAYRLCITAQLPPLVFEDELCTAKFNVRPAK